MRNFLQLAAIGSCLLTTTAFATPFTISSTLTGDSRASNPDNLFVNVTITGNTDTNQAIWLVDIDSPLHSRIKLDEFFFNLTGNATDYSFSAFSPTGWAVQNPATNAAGSGSADFMFKALDPAGQPNAIDITNSQNLSFTMTYAGGNLSTDNFLLAGEAVSSDLVLGAGQLGAHLQSLIDSAL